MAIQLPDTIADIAIPDTALVREITEFIRAAEDDLLFDHSRRVFLFGALQGRRRANPECVDGPLLQSAQFCGAHDRGGHRDLAERKRL